MTPVPTLYLRFVERMEIIYRSPGDELSTAQKVRVLQQFWEHGDGKEVVGNLFGTKFGTWRDIPLEKSND